MSMNSYPQFGHVVKAEDFLKLIPKDKITEFQLALDECDDDTLMGILDKTVLKDVGFTVFHLSDEDFAEHLEYSTSYVDIVRDNLFKMTPTPLMKRLEKDGVKPEETAWTVWA